MFRFIKKKIKNEPQENTVPLEETASINIKAPKKPLKRKMRLGIWAVSIYLITCIFIGMYWSREPKMFSVVDNAQQEATKLGIATDHIPVGFITVETLKKVAFTLLDKPGGYLTNDVFPPGVWLDNIPSWEYGVSLQVREMAIALRKDFSRVQSQSPENSHLVKAELSFNAENRWIVPATESRYEEGIRFLDNYKKQLIDPNDATGKFYPRADNLTNWLRNVETRLGSLSQRLSASVGKERIDRDRTDSLTTKELMIKTPWMQIDNVFYEARGQAWALVHLLRAAEVDFRDILAKKGATDSLQQIIRDLEASQQTVWSPTILNGSGYGMLANHSLVMANYISRANVAISDLRRLLEQG